MPPRAGASAQKGRPVRIGAIGCVIAVLALVCGCGEGVDEGAGAKAPASAAADAAAAPKKKVDPAQTGTISGVVGFAGAPPTPKRVKMTSSECSGLHKEEVQDVAVDVKDGKLAGALVRIRSGLEGYGFPAPAEPVVLDQEGCLFKPRLLGVMVGQRVLMKNSDDFLHNVHTFPELNDSYNRGFPTRGSTQETKFEQPEIVPVKCDVHTWMKAHIGVSPHPFFKVTGADGAYAFTGVPAGEYVVEVWHDTLKPVEQTVKLAAKGTATANFDVK